MLSKPRSVAVQGKLTQSPSALDKRPLGPPSSPLFQSGSHPPFVLLASICRFETEVWSREEDERGVMWIVELAFYGYIKVMLPLS